jgi:hypothetical protein
MTLRTPSFIAASMTHAELHRRLDDIVGADDVRCESDVVGLDQHARDGGEMHHRVGRTRRTAIVEAGKGGVGRQRVERLAAVRQISNQSRDARQVERLQIDIEDGIAMGDEMRNGVAAGLAGSAGEHNALAGHGF